MAADIIQARYAQLATIAQQFGMHTEGITSMHQRIQHDFTPLAQGGWVGTGSHAFFSDMQDTIFPATERLINAFQSAQEVMLQCVAIMQAAEEEAARIYQSSLLLDSSPAGAAIPAATHSGPATSLPGGPAFDADGNLIRNNLTVDEFELLTAAERIHWVHEMEKLAGDTWFHNIADIIAFFDESPTLHNMRRGSWASWADAGVLEAMQNGYVLSRGGVPVSLSMGAAAKWQDFFVAINDPRISDETRRSKWAIAEQFGVNYGSAIADDPARGGRPGGVEGALLETFVAAGNSYRALARIPDGGRQFGTNLGYELGSVAGAIGGLGVWGPAGTWIGGYMGGALGAEAGGETGDWFTDPRSTMPNQNHGPTYYSAKLVEQSIAGPAIFPGPVLPLVPLPPIPGVLPLPAGFAVGPGGTVSLPTGTIIDSDGTIRMAGGTVITPGGDVLPPGGRAALPIDGTLINPDGSLTLADGTIAR